MIEEAYRDITVGDGDRTVTMPMAQAVIRTLAVDAAKGKPCPVLRKKSIQRYAILFFADHKTPLSSVSRGTHEAPSGGIASSSWHLASSVSTNAANCRLMTFLGFRPFQPPSCVGDRWV